MKYADLRDFLAQLYISSAVTVFGLSAAIAYYAFRLADRAEAETERLLRNILPENVVERLREHPEEPIADAFSETSILFSDVQSFVPLSRKLGAERTDMIGLRQSQEFSQYVRRIWADLDVVLQ